MEEVHFKELIKYHAAKKSTSIRSRMYIQGAQFVDELVIDWFGLGIPVQRDNPAGMTFQAWASSWPAEFEVNVDTQMLGKMI